MLFSWALGMAREAKYKASTSQTASFHVANLLKRHKKMKLNKLYRVQEKSNVFFLPLNALLFLPTFSFRGKPRSI